MMIFRAAMLLWRRREGDGDGPWWMPPAWLLQRDFDCPAFSLCRAGQQWFFTGNNVSWHRAESFWRQTLVWLTQRVNIQRWADFAASRVTCWWFGIEKPQWRRRMLCSTLPTLFISLGANINNASHCTPLHTIAPHHTPLHPIASYPIASHCILLPMCRAGMSRRVTANTQQSSPEDRISWN